MAALLGLALLVFAQIDETPALAEQAGVSEQDLRGAVASTGLPARDYLQMTGEIAPPPARASVWEALASCESDGNWRTNTRNGYYGGLQEDLVFWRRYGGLSYAARPDLATPEAQITVAQRGLASQGWRAWPLCSRRLGLR